MKLADGTRRCLPRRIHGREWHLDSRDYQELKCGNTTGFIVQPTVRSSRLAVGTTRGSPINQWNGRLHTNNGHGGPIRSRSLYIGNGRQQNVVHRTIETSAIRSSGRRPACPFPAEESNYNIRDENFPRQGIKLFEMETVPSLLLSLQANSFLSRYILD